MKRTIKERKEVNIVAAVCRIYARYWEDSEINGKEDDAENPQMPFLRADSTGRKFWNPVIMLDTGKIANWPQGVVADIHYKSCDTNAIDLICDEDFGVVKEYEGYVPRFLYPEENGYGDYVIMHIDEDGYIRNFSPEIDDLFEEDER